MDLESTKQPRKRLIIKFSSQKNHSTSKPIVTCFWLDAKDSTAIMSQQNNNKELSTPTDSKPILSKEVGVQVMKDSCSKKIINETRNPRTENCGLKAAGGEIKNEKRKKPMQHYKKMQCWVILKRMLIGRDSWPLKDPVDLKLLKASHHKDNLESKYKLKTMGLKDIEAKLELYSTPDEFANDVRFVFSQRMLLYPPRNEIHKIAMKFSESFENKWKSLKKDWELEERKRNKRKMDEHVHESKDFFQTKRSR
ncbi:transcription factor GTE5, chloroplastic-like [Cicer arietinum]|uniref:Transcription factor GTE12-like n=1 Tax=Cicer arietinum TaxID=3827 RepID=A0A1S2Z5W3_CICAR|nr:transcription factor GTE12-like [Cicer arietinum]